MRTENFNFHLRVKKKQLNCLKKFKSVFLWTENLFLEVILLITSSAVLQVVDSLPPVKSEGKVNSCKLVAVVIRVPKGLQFNLFFQCSFTKLQ